MLRRVCCGPGRPLVWDPGSPGGRCSLNPRIQSAGPAFLAPGAGSALCLRGGGSEREERGRGPDPTRAQEGREVAPRLGLGEGGSSGAWAPESLD